MIQTILRCSELFWNIFKTFWNILKIKSWKFWKLYLMNKCLNNSLNFWDIELQPATYTTNDVRNVIQSVASSHLCYFQKKRLSTFYFTMAVILNFSNIYDFPRYRGATWYIYIKWSRKRNSIGSHHRSHGRRHNTR